MGQPPRQGLSSDAAAFTKCLGHDFGLGDDGCRRYVGGQPHIVADLRSFTHADTTDDHRTGIDHPIIVRNRMMGYALARTPCASCGKDFALSVTA